MRLNEINARPRPWALVCFCRNAQQFDVVNKIQHKAQTLRVYQSPSPYEHTHFYKRQRIISISECVRQLRHIHIIIVRNKKFRVAHSIFAVAWILFSFISYATEL